MRNILQKSFDLIPLSKRKKLPTYLVFSLVNTVLDLISIIYLVPIILVLLDRHKLKKLTTKYLDIELTENLILILLVSLIVFYVVKNGIQTKIIRFQSKFIYCIATSISRRLMSTFISESYKTHTASDKNIFFRDVFQLPITFASNILFPIYNIFSEVFILLIIAVVSFIYNPFVTMISLLILTILSYLLMHFQKKKVTAFNESIVHLYQENVKNIMNIIQGFVEIRTTKSERQFQKKFEIANKKSNEQLAQLLAFKQSNLKYFEILFILGLSLGIFFFLYSKDNTNDLIFLSFLAGASVKIIPSFNKILNAYLDIKANRNAVDVLSKYQESFTKGNGILSFQKSMKLQNIGFAYEEKSILKQLDLEIVEGDFISISGNSGQGKTSLLQIIAGLLKPKTGNIAIDDVFVDSNIPFEFVGYAPQQPFLFQGTIKENITMLHEPIDLDHLNNILEKLHLTEWITNLPSGIDTPLLLESKELSGGQKQRIALARVLYFKPKLLLLDETTNQLNHVLEDNIVTYLRQLADSKKLTIVAVSHGKRIAEFSSRKYVLENGKLRADE